MDPIMIPIAFVLLFLTLAVASYLIFRRPKNVVANSPPVWLDTLSEDARNVHLRELNKQTPRKFSKQWFLEYWRGQRSPFYVWLTWLVIGRGALLIAIFTSGSILSAQSSNEWGPENAPVFLITAAVISIIYISAAGIMLWRCAKNARRGFKYFARLYAILAPIAFVVNIFSLV